MRNFRDIPIKQKVTFITLLTSCVAIMISSAVFIVGDLLNSRRELAKEVSTTAQIVGRNSAAAILFDDERAAADILAALASKPNIISGSIVTADARVFATYIRDPQNGAASESDATGSPADSISVAEPITVDGGTIGHIILKSDLAYIYNQMQLQLAVATIATLLSLMIAVILSSRLERVITRPIMHLVDVMRSVTWGRNYGTRALKHGHDELGVLIDGFNAMLEEIEANQDSLAARMRAESANRAKSEFLANMSHELRTPLNAILGFSEILGKQQFGPLGCERYRSYVEDIHDSGKHLLGIINDILDLSKAEAGKLTLDEDDVALEGVIRQCLRMLDARATAQGVTITPHFPARVPRLSADARLVSQVLINLLTNSVKFTPEGGSVTISFDAEADGGCVIRIADTGIGIAPENIAKVRKPFAQVATAFSRNHQGTGLGLPLVDQIMKLHGGSLEIESALGVGTTVSIRFPAERVLPLADEFEADPPQSPVAPENYGQAVASLGS